MNFPQGLLGGGQASPFSLLGFQPFRPNFGAGLLGGNQFAASPFQRTPYQPQRFPAPNIQSAPAQTQAPATAQQFTIPDWAFALELVPGAFRDMANDPWGIRDLLARGP